MDWGYRQRGSAEKMPSRFRAKIRMGPACWEFTSTRSPNGYGMFRVGDHQLGAHRVAWMLANGPIPEGLFVLHHCDNKLCVKTDGDEQWPEGHLFLGTPADNTHDMYAKGRAAPLTLYGSAKLSRPERNEIRRRRATGETCSSIAKDFNVSPETVSHLTIGRIWKIDFQEGHA